MENQYLNLGLKDMEELREKSYVILLNIQYMMWLASKEGRESSVDVLALISGHLEELSEDFQRIAGTLEQVLQKEEMRSFFYWEREDTQYLH